MSSSDVETDNSINKTEDKLSTSLAPTIHDFDILKPISRGAFGKVFLCNRKDAPDKKFAVKVMKKSEMVQKNMVDQVIAERNALAITKSPFVVGLLYCLQTINNVFLVMEYMIGGDLKSLLSVYGYLEEDHAVFYFAECVMALQYLHSRDIVHRDIKPDNMLISHSGHLKLTDFGLSSTGMKDKELHVADIVSKTPFPAGSKAHRERLIRTPGQILSLTSHLSFGECSNESLGGSYTIKDSTSQTCDVSEYGRQSRAGHVPCNLSGQHSVASHVSECNNMSGTRPNSMSFCATLPTPSSCVVTTPNDKNYCTTSSSQDMVTPVQSNKVRLVRKNSFSLAMAKHVRETKEQELSRVVLDRNAHVVRNNSGSPENKHNSSALQPLPNSSFDFGSNKTIEFAKDNDEVFEEDKENVGFPSSPLNKCIPSSPLNRLTSPPQSSDFPLQCQTPSPPSPSYNIYKMPDLNMFNEDSMGSMSSSPKNNIPRLQEPINISPLKPVTFSTESPSSIEDPIIKLTPKLKTCESDVHSIDMGDNVTPVLTPNARDGHDEAAAENMRSLRDMERTLSPEILRCDMSFQSWDSDIHLDRETPSIERQDKTLEMDVSEMTEQQTESLSNTNIVHDSSKTSSEDECVSNASTPSPLPLPRLLSPDHDSSMMTTPNNFKIPAQSSSLNRKRKCSNESPEIASTHLTDEFTELILAKKVKIDNDQDGLVGTKQSHSSTSSSSSEEEGRQGIGFSTPVHQSNSTPLSSVPPHMQKFKGMKAVKFVSPAGLTPVQHPDHGVMTQPPFKMPFSLAELDTSNPPSTPKHFNPSPHTFKTPSHPSTRMTPLRTPKSIQRQRRTQEASRILGTPDYLAPELLLGQRHGKEVDWWALGACLYEFMTGCPPFNDETPECVFENILSLNIEWPDGEESLSPAAVQCIMSLLCIDPTHRADHVTLQTQTELTQGVQWSSILDQAPPWIPQPDNASDTTYFHAKNNIQGLKVSCVDI